MAWGDFTNPEAWKQAMAGLLRRGGEVGEYVATAPEKAGQAILDASQRQSALMNEAFDPTGKTLIRNPQAANQAAMNLFEGPLSIAPVGMMIGPNSALWNKENAFKASKMEKAGKTPQEIWEATGTARGLDNHWRQELSDHNVPMLSYGTAKELNKYPSMENVLGHKELFKSYGNRIAKAPVGNDLAEFTKDVYGKPQVGGASFREYSNEYTVSPRPYGATSPDYGKAQKGGLLHELQHGVQSIEDWARGGNTKTFTQQKDAELARDILNFRKEIDRYSHLKDNDAIEQAIKNDYKKLGASEWMPNQETINLAFDLKGNPSNELQSIVNLYGLDKSTTPRTPEQMYNLLAGEVEARLTHNRMDLTPEQRLQNFPFKQGKYGIDINPEEAIIKNVGDKIVTRKQLLEQLLNEQK